MNTHPHLQAQQDGRVFANLLSGISFLVLLILFVAPIGMMIVVSFYKPDPMGFYKVAFVWDNYLKFFSGFYAKVSFRSIWSAALASALVVALAFPTIIFVSDLSRRWQQAWIIMLLALMCLSEVIVGFAWLILYSESAGVPKLLEALGIWSNPRSLTPSFFGMLTGLVTLGFSIVALILYPQAAGRDRSLEEAAQTLGTPRPQVFAKVLIPTFAKTLMATVLTMFVYLLGVFVMPTMLGRPKDWTMTVMIQDKAMGDANLPLGAALAVVMLIFTILLMGLVALVVRGRKGAQA